jgi:tetratricopeptide (TPR) repeat protein
MDIRAVLNEYDAMFGVKKAEEIEEFLELKMAQSRRERDKDALFAIMNEYVGLTRNLRHKEKCLEACDEILNLAEEIRILNSPQHATMMLNVGTAFSAFGRNAGAEVLFEDVEKLLGELGEKDTYTLATLYNNWSMLLLKQKRFAETVELQKKALSIIDPHDDLVMEQATTRSNMASTLMRQYEVEKKEELLDEAERILEESFGLYEKDGGKSFHYGTALITKGDIRMLRKDYAGAARAYEASMKNLEQYLNRGQQYQTAKALYEKAKTLAEDEQL